MPVRVNIPNVGAVNFPDGMSEDDIHSAVDGIYSQGIAANPPRVARPNVNMRPASLARQPGTSYQTDEPVPTSGLGALEYQHPVASALGEVGGIAALGAAGTAAAPVLAGLTPVAVKWIAANPGKAAFAYELARHLGVPVPNLLKYFVKGIME
jgi:hypothetical protein